MDHETWDAGLYEHVWDFAKAVGANSAKLERLERSDTHLIQILNELCQWSRRDLVQALEGVGFEDAESIIDEVLNA